MVSLESLVEYVNNLEGDIWAEINDVTANFMYYNEDMDDDDCLGSINLDLDMPDTPLPPGTVEIKIPERTERDMFLETLSIFLTDILEERKRLSRIVRLIKRTLRILS